MASWNECRCFGLPCCHGHHRPRPHRAASQRSFRVSAYAGTDPVTGKPRRLKQTCPDEAAAAAALGKLLGQADGDRFPDREATLGQALAQARQGPVLAFGPAAWRRFVEQVKAGA